ncbi:MAG: hypothetical protein ACOH15_04880 [Acetobacterium sp.]
MDIEDKDFKIGLLKEFWDQRNRDFVPASEHGIGIKKQKFLVFYNLIARSLGETYTISNMKAFKEGPVYYDIYSYIKETNEYLEQKTIKNQTYSKDIINATLRLVESESYDSLSKITHSLNLWKKKFDKEYDEEIIGNDFKYDKNNIESEDIVDEDNKIIKILFEYNLYLYENYDLIKKEGKMYAIEKENKEKIMEIINSGNPYLNKTFEELLKIDTLATVSYSEDYIEDELEGILIDI